MSSDKRSILVRAKNDALKHLLSNSQSKVVKQLRSAGITLEVHQSTGFEMLDIRPVNLLIVVNLGESIPVEYGDGDGWVEGTFNHDDIEIIPADHKFSWRSAAPMNCLVASLDDSVFRKISPASNGDSTTLFGTARRV